MKEINYDRCTNILSLMKLGNNRLSKRGKKGGEGGRKGGEGGRRKNERKREKRKDMANLCAYQLD